ncbi:hypothetical protein H0H92_009476 [Tricholoma furcatifolium]|nr:hypothetical protein H0H92_009476 [Tricholoma furcatifolium]
MSGTAPERSDNLSSDTGNTSAQEAEAQESTVYPPQRHAGKVGYGPAYHIGPTFGERIKGYEEEVKGHLTHDPALTEHGKQLASGEIRRKEREQDMNESSAVQSAGHASSEKGGKQKKVKHSADVKHHG